MKNRKYTDHLKSSRDKYNHQIVELGERILNCHMCYQALEKAINKELQAYATVKFATSNQYLLSMEWEIPLSFVELDPHLFDRLESRVKNFLEKNQRLDAIYRVDLNLPLSCINVTLLFVSERTISLKVATDAVKDWTSFYPTELYYRDADWVDQYEFYVWAVPFAFDKTDMAFISGLKDENVLKDILFNRVVIIEGEYPELTP